MTAVVNELKDVRELSDVEIEAVAGGPVWFIVAGAALLLAGCATNDANQNAACNEDANNDTRDNRSPTCPAI